MKHFLKNYFYRTKDNNFVFCAVKKVLEQAIPMAAEMGIQISQVVHKVCILIFMFAIITFIFQTDRPSSQYWNSGMVRAHKELAQEFNVSITHISEQSCHNKVSQNKTYNSDKEVLKLFIFRIGWMGNSRLLRQLFIGI